MEGSVGLLIIGTEILNGYVVDKNTSFFAEHLFPLNMYLKRVKIIPDSLDVILENFKAFSARFDITITTGGLGPTHDDLTIDALCNFLNCNSRYDSNAKKKLEKFYSNKKNISNKQIIYKQVRYPDKAESLLNKVGFSPGIWVEKYRILCFPGFPIEIKSIWPYAEKKLISLSIDKNIMREIIPIWMVGESTIFSDINFPKEIKVGVHALPYGVRLFLEVNQKSHQQILQDIKKQLYDQYQYYICENPLKHFLSYCLKNQIKFAGSESCTGGLISSQITDIPGVSAIFQGSIICYDNTVKSKVLKIEPNILEQYGAVSKETVIAMCKNSLDILNADVSFAITGIAGPTGGSKTKPVGLVYIAITHKKQSNFWCGKFLFNFGRERFRNAATSMVFMMLYQKFVLKMTPEEWVKISPKNHYIINK